MRMRYWVRMEYDFSAGSDDQLVTSLYRCTALLLHTCPSSPSSSPSSSSSSHLPQLHRSLLSSVTQLPVKNFTEVAITTAIQCWQWLLTAAPVLEFPVSLFFLSSSSLPLSSNNHSPHLQFMRELCAVWKWSVEERRGLFSKDHTPSLGYTNEKREPIQTRQHTLIIQVPLTPQTCSLNKNYYTAVNYFPSFSPAVPGRQVWSDSISQLCAGPVDIRGSPPVPHSGGGAWLWPAATDVSRSWGCLPQIQVRSLSSFFLSLCQVLIFSCHFFLWLSTLSLMIS